MKSVEIGLVPNMYGLDHKISSLDHFWALQAGLSYPLKKKKKVRVPPKDKMQTVDMILLVFFVH